MKILVIMKRFGANKDMVMQNFGRQIRLFEPLAKKHKIDFLCPDYKKHSTKDIKKRNINYYIRPYSILRHFKFTKELKNIIKKNNYDVIVGTTDPLIGILGYFYSKKFNIKYVYDMQDEYSCYDTYKVPFVKRLDKIAVKNSDVILTVSDSLNNHVKKFRKKPTYTIQNGIDTKSFKKISKIKARKSLHLPEGKIIIYIGEISKFKGVDVLIEAFKEVKKVIPNTYLLLSGKISDSINVNQNSIIYEKYPKRKEVITALNAADIAILPNKKNIFSMYCFPYKLVEYMYVDLPIVATKIGDASVILSKFNDSLCKPNDKYDMADKIMKKLNGKAKINYSRILKKLTWNYLANKLESIIKK
ncbi:glycosyltransferase family 4 protein [archaeon AH-315-M20]|nr:glycosyltransferase family 4 protein [archaeon AH-315-M20]